MRILRKALSSVLFCVFLVLSSVSYSQEASEDYWQEQRDYYQQYQAWELPTEAIVSWLNQLEQSEKDLIAAQNNSNEVLSVLNPLKGISEEVLTLLERQRSLLVRQSVITVVSLCGMIIVLLSNR